jgi:hypothetical protein
VRAALADNNLFPDIKKLGHCRVAAGNGNHHCGETAGSQPREARTRRDRAADESREFACSAPRAHSRSVAIAFLSFSRSLSSPLRVCVCARHMKSINLPYIYTPKRAEATAVGGKKRTLEFFCRLCRRSDFSLDFVSTRIQFRLRRSLAVVTYLVLMLAFFNERVSIDVIENLMKLICAIK